MLCIYSAHPHPFFPQGIILINILYVPLLNVNMKFYINQKNENIDNLSLKAAVIPPLPFCFEAILFIMIFNSSCAS